uniref:RRM domain-containing protein n=1 Tax=Clastoptera arizonana TaxID=38151 RepID=A0A1B6DYP9_9HEMI
MLIKDTLLIRHFPSQLSHKEKEEFLTHFGAVDVQILGSENQKSNIIYAKYETETAAQIALKKLHQLEILDEILCVEIARGNKNCNNLHFPRFDIRLMQEGRMKGQAFVSLQTVELAQKALKETNGYILKEKPMVVQFARSAPTKL